MAAQLEKIGIKTSVEVVESGAFSTDMTDGNYDLALGSFNTGTTGDPDYALAMHFGSAGSYAKQTGYTNPDVDDWLNKARTTFDQEERMDYYKQVQKQAYEDLPEITLFYLNVLVGQSEKVEGFVMYPSSEINFLTPELSLED